MGNFRDWLFGSYQHTTHVRRGRQRQHESRVEPPGNRHDLH
jgi:hypothetical protein